MLARLTTALIATCALISLGASGASSATHPVEIPIPRLQMAIESSITPKRLSSVEPTPIALDIGGRISTVDHSHPPALKELVLDLDKDVRIDAHGLPACETGGRGPRFPNLKSLCKESVVGRGRVEFQIQFPELPSISTATELIVVKGDDRRGAGTTLYGVAYLTQPITTAVVMAISITRHLDANRLTIHVPEVANGAGSPTYLRIKLNKRFTRNGEAVDLLTGRCRGGTIQSGVKALFADGTVLGADILQRCAPEPS